jgi:LacI family transcriptional regulator
MKERDHPATLVDVARAAGVSPSTVSRIMNGTARVADAKRQAVLAAIERMHFAPNQMARSLKKGCTMTVGIVVQDISSPFFDETLRGVDDALLGTGYTSVVVSGHWNADEEADRIRLLLARKVDGIILLTGRMSDETVLQFARERPIVATGRQLRSPGAIGFKVDNEHGAFVATRHLIDAGHRRIAFITGPAASSDANERLAGYRRALRSAGIAADAALIVEGDFHEHSGQRAIEHLLAHAVPFSAVFAANDLSAYGARLALYRHGVRVPEDVSLVGFDDLPGSMYTAPPLTTVRQPLYDLGRAATKALLSLLGRARPDDVVPPVELVVRETTRCVG